MKEIIEFLHKIQQYKKIKRAGWVRKKIPDPESDADHSFAVTMMTYLLADRVGIDKDKAIKMALIHDLHEVVCGDITPHDNYSKEEKDKIESDAMKQLVKDIDNKEMLELWNELAEEKTPEAKFIENIDKLELAFQTYLYEKENPNLDLEEFWTFCDKRIKDPKLREIFKSLKHK
ncbi:MAG: HD domain-containing protein [archaeon]